MGEPSGSGTDILLKSWAEICKFDRRSLVLDDPHRLRQAADQLGVNVAIVPIKSYSSIFTVARDSLAVLPLSTTVPYAPGRPTPKTAPQVIEALDRAVLACLSGEAAAMVTLPIQKNLLYAAKFPYPGHTEFLAAKAKVNKTVMMLAADKLRVVPVTVHQSIASVAGSLTIDLLIETARITVYDLKKRFGLAAPRLVFAGLNPHAGENGTMGREEIEVITPAIDTLSKEGFHITGPFPADTLFHTDMRSTYDAALCMYHDQALIPLKTLDFWSGINVTLGLPFIRTSPDHGTATGLAGTGKARADSLIAAIKAAHAMVDQEQTI